KISDALAAEDIAPFRHLIEQYEQEHNVPAIEIAAALARLVQGDRPLLLKANAGGGVPVVDKSRLTQAVLAGPDRPSGAYERSAPPRDRSTPSRDHAARVREPAAAPVAGRPAHAASAESAPPREDREEQPPRTE